VQRGLDHVLQVHAAAGEHEERLRQRLHRMVQHERAQLLARRRAARLAREHRLVAARAHPLAQEGEVRGLAGAVDALERDELAARRHFFSW
jgi:hypothetical protein